MFNINDEELGDHKKARENEKNELPDSRFIMKNMIKKKRADRPEMRDDCPSDDFPVVPEENMGWPVSDQWLLSLYLGVLVILVALVLYFL